MPTQQIKATSLGPVGEVDLGTPTPFHNQPLYHPRAGPGQAGGWQQ